MTTPTVDLYDLAQPALIIPSRHGVIYNQQTGGYACRQHEMRGYLVPVPAYVSQLIEDLFVGVDWCSSIEFDAITKAWTQSSWSIFLTVDRESSESEEAWLHVDVMQDNPYLPHYAGPAVLTWENSD